MSGIMKIPFNKEIKDYILQWCKVHSPSHNSNWCVEFEIELSGIFSQYYWYRHGHVFEALGFSFSMSLLIKAMFEPLCGGISKSIRLEA